LFAAPSTCHHFSTMLVWLGYTNVITKTSPSPVIKTPPLFVAFGCPPLSGNCVNEYVPVCRTRWGTSDETALFVTDDALLAQSIRPELRLDGRGPPRCPGRRSTRRRPDGLSVVPRSQLRRLRGQSPDDHHCSGVFTAQSDTVDGAMCDTRCVCMLVCYVTSHSAMITLWQVK